MGDREEACSNVKPASLATSDHKSSLEQVKGLLNAKDDTSRFVGLALLKSLLDNHSELREDVAQVVGIWDAISPKFLDRLLKSGQSYNIIKQEAKNMVDIAVAVLHTFAILLPAEARNDKRFVGRTAALINTLVYSSPESTVLILQSLVTFASQLPGAIEIVDVKDFSPLTEISLQYPMALDVLRMAWSNASTDNSQVHKVKHSFDKAIPMLLNTFRDSDGVTLMTSVGDTLRMLPHEAIPGDPAWLPDLVLMLRKLVTSRPTQAARSAYTQLAGSVLQAYPLKTNSLLFTDQEIEINHDPKPFCYLFISLILVDIRSTIPSLLSKLNGAEYLDISKRLASAFDVLTHFISFLVHTLDDDETPPIYSFNMPPDFLLKMRKNIAESMSLTMEYLRDRWDASIAGTAGLHPLARTGTTSTSEGTRLTLTWDSTETRVQEDSMILASFRTLALWLTEDENDGLRNEMGGLMDMLLELYQGSTISDAGSGHSKMLNFRSTTLRILEAVIPTDDDVIEQFLQYNGWEILSKDLIKFISNSEMDENFLETDIVRVLLAVLDHESTTEPREDWMIIVRATVSMKPPVLEGESTILDEELVVMDSQVAVLQLVAALLNLAGSGMRKRYFECTTAITRIVKTLQTDIDGLKNDEWQECLDSLDDVAMVLENLD